MSCIQAIKYPNLFIAIASAFGSRGRRLCFFGIRSLTSGVGGCFVWDACEVCLIGDDVVEDVTFLLAAIAACLPIPRHFSK